MQSVVTVIMPVHISGFQTFRQFHLIVGRRRSTEVLDANLTWGNERSYPEFTECFQNTVILWLPSILLVVTAPLYLYILLKYEDAYAPWSWKSLGKISLVVLQLSVRYLQLGRTDGGSWGIRRFGLLTEGCFLFLLILYTHIERKKGFVTSGIQTIYWFLASLCWTLLWYSKMVKQGYDSNSDESITMKTYLALCLVQFILTWFADNPNETKSERECKLLQYSFVSRCFFLWFDSFMSLGYKRPLEDKDISAMMPNDQPEIAIPKFERTWKLEQARLEEKYKISGIEERVGLFKVMIMANWPVLLAANLLKLFAEVFILSKPFVTGLLVGFAEDLNQPAWKGFIYLFVGVICLMGDDVTCGYMRHLCQSTALRLNHCLKSAIFKKAMRMTNKARNESTVGEIVNVFGQDVGQVQHFVAFLFWLWCVPFELLANLAILCSTVDYAGLAGVSVLAVVMPLNMYFARQGHSTHLARMDKKDSRIKLMTEVLNGIKILKLYAWEMVFGDKILELRNEEINILRKQRTFRIIASICWTLAPFMMSLVTFAVYVHISADHMLTAKTAFHAMATFGMLTHTFNALPHIGQHFMRSFASIRRVEKFLNNIEIPEDIVSNSPSDDAITINKGTFTWDKKLGPCLQNINMTVPKGSLVAVVGTVGSGKSSLLSAILGEIEKDAGDVNVHGTIAYVPQQAWIQNNTLKDNVLFGHKYRQQTYNDVIEACSLKRDLEILPGRDMTEIGEKGINLSGGQKQRVSMARAVYFNSDIYLLDDPLSAVDAHVGKDIFENVLSENGLLRNKTRVLVTHGITWLPRVDKIFVIEHGEISETGTYEQLMENKGAFAEFIQKYKQEENNSDDEEDTVDVVRSSEVSVNEGTDAELINDLLEAADKGTPISCSSVVLERLMSDSGYTSETTEMSDMNTKSKSKATKKEMKFKRSISRAISIEDKQDHKERPKKLIRMATFDDSNKMNEERIKRESEKMDTGKLIDDEEIETGKVKFKYILPYFKAIGTVPCILILLFFLGFKLCEIGQSVSLKDWTSDGQLNNLTLMSSDSEERYYANMYYIQIYLFIGIMYCITDLSTTTILAYGVLRASTVLHEKMLKNILRGPMSFFDTTPVGRITNRFSGDIEPLDGAISDHTERILHCIFGLISIFLVIMTSLPNFAIMAVPIFLAYNEIQKRFVPVRRQLSRMESKKRSPVYSHFTESLNGVHVIRAFNMQEKFAAESASKVNVMCEVFWQNRTVDRWIDLRLCVLNVLCFAATTYFVIMERERLDGAVVGMVITFVLQLNGNLEWFVRMSGEMERDVVCIERIGEYSSTKQEAPLHTSVVPQKSWPESGNVEISNYSVRYREGLDLVLKNINVNVKPGEKVGIVGRTGAGKSSLTLGLFRLIEPAAGSINIDKHDISRLGLFDLRSNLTILPQEPVLFSGTLRTNLDPLKAFTDEAIFTALEHAHLKSFIDTLPGKLSYDCGEGGQNLSVGQRQLICLARSLLRKSNVLVLDEATAAVDMKTDELIQNTIRKEFQECTVLTIAHRLNTIIDYDRILVLEHGEVKEFDSPKLLLQNKKSAFYGMAKDAGLVK
ncbi:multidrug resistance-associated protein 1-like [Mercenaria mercenaria]|uniref:multidrug resistance-associated protein 1-like n=1 Tax=Mercenaria mercenaria TaxID=6596 RepID=UPI00234EE9F6|nr:multidrug resistance-associated protein 1-like [Mercenaria mercenaria]